MNQNYKEHLKPLVSICTLIYNHEQFLPQYFKGILMQNTNFNFEVLIHDDASTDNSSKIIRKYQKEYPSIFKPIIQTENQYSQGVDINLKYNFSRAQGKYIALCEGDDYWTDPLKLQKQVDFLESHPEYNLYCSNWKELHKDSIVNSPVHTLYKTPFSFSFATLPRIWITKTATLMFRHNGFNYELLTRYKNSRDIHLIYHLLIYKRGYFDPSTMAVYRIHPHGIWGNLQEVEKKETSYNLYKELFIFEKNKVVRKRYLHAALALFNAKFYQNQSVRKSLGNFSLYVEACKLIRSGKDLIYTIGALFPKPLVQKVLNFFKVKKGYLSKSHLY